MGMQKDGVTFIAKGRGGQLVVTPTKVIIQRKGLLGAASQQGSKEIRIDQISAVQLKKPGLTAGFIRFSFVGGQESKRAGLSVAYDENAIVIPGHYGEFVKAKELIEQYQQAMAQAQRTPVVAPALVSAADELEKLAALRDRGILSAAEFEAKKQQVLGL